MWLRSIHNNLANSTLSRYLHAIEFLLSEWCGCNNLCRLLVIRSEQWAQPSHAVNMHRFHGKVQRTACGDSSSHAFWAISHRFEVFMRLVLPHENFMQLSPLPYRQIIQCNVQAIDYCVRIVAMRTASHETKHSGGPQFNLWPSTRQKLDKDPNLGSDRNKQKKNPVQLNTENR